MPKTKALARDDRKRQILLTFAVEMNGGRDVELTIADIARKIHLSPSQKLRDMVMELVIDGALQFRDEAIPGIAKFRRLYFANPVTYKRPSSSLASEPRKIKVNSKQGSFFEVLQ